MPSKCPSLRSSIHPLTKPRPENGFTYRLFSSASDRIHLRLLQQLVNLETLDTLHRFLRATPIHRALFDNGGRAIGVKKVDGIAPVTSGSLSEQMKRLWEGAEWSISNVKYTISVFRSTGNTFA